MAADNSLARIASLVDRLDPLSGKTRGMRIEADEWNSLVDVLLGLLQVERAQVERAQSQLAEGFAAKNHQHLGEVNTAWLDAELQARTGGRDSSLSARALLADMDSKITSLGSEVARLTALVDTQQKLIDRSAVSELDRARTLKQFDDRFAGVENLRTLVSTLSTDVGAVKGNVATVLELRKSLSDAAGNPIDVAKMRQDLADVQGLRDNLKGVDGDLLRLRDVEVKLRELSDAVGVGAAGGLDARIGSVVAGAEQRLDGKINERATGLQEALGAGISASEIRLRGELTGGIDATRASLDQSVIQQVGAAEGRLTIQFDAKLTQTATGVRADTLSATGSLLDSRLAALPDQIRGIATGIVDGARTGLRDELRTGLTDLDAKLGALDTRLSGRAGALDTRVTGVETGLPGVVNAQLDSFGQALETRLSQRVDTSVETARQALQNTLSAQVKTAVTETVGNLDARIATTVDGQLANLDTRIAQSVTAATRNLPQDIAGEVNRQVAGLNLPGQIKDATGALAQQLRAEQVQAIADVQAKSSTAVSNAVTVLRGEISALRTETLSTIDTRVNTSNTALRKELTTNLTTLQGSIKPDAFRAATLNTGTTVVRPIS
jgi:hypothetical protein